MRDRDLIPASLSVSGRHAVAALLLVLVAVGGACFGSSSVPTVQYFRLPIWVGAQKPSTSPLPIVLQVEEFDVEPAYDHLRVVYRVSPVELRHYRLRLWVAKPGRLVGDSVRQYLDRSGRFRMVTGESRPIPDYILRGKVIALEQIETGEKGKYWFARVAVNLRLVRASDGTIVWTKRIDMKSKVEPRKPTEVVGRVTTMLRNSLDDAMPNLGTIIRQDLSRKGRLSKKNE